MRTFTYWMSATALATSALAVGCSDDAGEDVAVADLAGGGTGGMEDMMGVGGSESMAGAEDVGDSGGAGGMVDMAAGAGGMAEDGGAGGMGSLDSGELDAGTEAPDSGFVPEEEEDPVVAESQFAPLYNEIFSPLCSGCHGGSYGSADEQFSYDVITGNPTSVVNRLNGIGNTMPLGCENNDTCLSQDQLDAVDAWVEAGTPR